MSCVNDIALTKRNAAMSMRILRLSLTVLTTLLLTADRARAMSEILGQTKEQLKLKYEVAVQEHSFGGESTGRVTIMFTLADEGRLKPLDWAELVIPGKEKQKDGGYRPDLVVGIELHKADDGKRVARVHLRKEWADRAEIWLHTNSMDGKKLVERVITSSHLANT